MRPRSLRILLACLLSLLLAVGAAPSVARAAEGELRAPLPRVPVLLDVWAVSGSHVLAVVDGALQISHDQGSTWEAANLPAWAAGNPEDAVYSLGLDEGLALLTDEEESRAALYSLADNQVTRELSFPDGYVYRLSSTHALVGGNGYRLVTLDGSVADRDLPSGYNWSSVLEGGVVAGYLWGDDDERTVVLADSSGDISELGTIDSDAGLWFGGDAVVWQQAYGSATLCARTITGPGTSTCQTLPDVAGEPWIWSVVLDEGVLVDAYSDGDNGSSYFWVPLSDGALQAPVRVTLGSDVKELSIVRAADAPVFSTLTSTESYLEWVSDLGATSRVATGLRKAARQTVTGLTPTDVLLQGLNADYAATTWRRSVGSTIGSPETLAAIDGSRASTSAPASAGRWLVPSAETEITLYDRGTATETISDLYANGRLSGYDAVGGLSGPNLLIELEDTWQQRNAAGTWTSVPRAQAIFGGLVLEDLSDYDADEFVAALRVRDLSGDGSATIEFSPPDFDGGEIHWWGDTVAYERDALCYDEESDEEQDAAQVYNFRTGAVVNTVCGELIALGDGFIVVRDTEGPAAVNLATEARTDLEIWGWEATTDGARVAYTTGTELVIQTIPGVARSAPRSLGVKAPASYDGTGLWTPEIDLTKPVSAGDLVIKNASGTVVRSLNVPASADGSIRGVGWDGKDLSDQVVAKGTYTIELTTPAADGTGVPVRTDGTPGALAKVAVDIPTATPTLVADTPTITGTAAVGSTLTARPGQWSPSDVAFTYQWLADGSQVANGPSSSYVLSAAEVGKRISVRVTGSLTGYGPASATSAQTSAVQAGKLSAGAPSISGTAQVGQKLTANAGSWGPVPVSLAHQWNRNGTAISGATSAAYTAVAADMGARITVTVTGTKTGYTRESRTSAATGPVAGLKLTATPAPTIAGTVKVGSTLTASPGTWAPGTVSFAYQWLRGGVAIAGATNAKYVLVGEDAGKTISVTVTGAQSGYTPVAKTSTATAKVAVGTLTSATPKITGTAKVGVQLTVSVGAWEPAPVTFTYQWYRSGKAIKGATAASYVLTASDKDKVITVTVTGSKTGYAAMAETSAKTKKVAIGTLQAPVPKIAGTTKVGKKLTATAGSWGPSPVTLKYQWYRSGKKIAKATKATYKLVAADKGKTISVKVTGSKTGFKAVTKTSKATAKVKA